MSSQPPAASANSSALSKSAKKKAKKAAKAAKQESVDAALAAVEEDLSSSAQFASVAASRLALNAAVDFPSKALDPYYEEAVAKLGIDPAAAAVANAAAAAAAARSGGIPPDHLSFASYAFDHTLGAPPGDNPFGSGFSPSVGIGHDELLETANELFRRMHYDSYGEDDPYWSSLPPHVRQFIREAIPFNGQSNSSNDPHATQKDLYAMAQRIVNAASQGIGSFQGAGTNLLSSVNGRAQHMTSSIAEDLGFHNHPNHSDPIAREDEYDDDDDYEDDPEPGLVQANGDAPKKKNKKKKKKAAQSVEPPPATLPPPAVKQPPRQPVPPQPQPPIPQPQLNPPPPPVTAAPPAQPPPSSRAAGKQPMTHAPVPAANPPARSVRAAGKAPVSASQHTHHNHTHPPPPKPASKGKAATPVQPAKIWTTASAEERENITQFWLALDDAERKSLLQVEKDAILKRMKEQQRHSCGCAVCGRKKVNIEMELDQLYDSYYEELERYTSHQRAAIANQDCPPPPGAGPFPGSVELDSTGQLLKLDHLAPNPSQHPSQDESDEYDDDEEYDDEEELDDDDLASEEADADYPPRKAAPKPLAPRPEGGDDFFGFGTNLATIKGIITVADDMLKNDGAKFLEMMEQLAVKRVAREELNARELQEETDDDDEDDDISESQRMEDGRRMFAIFAARMFENRVLQSFRERIAKEREEQLLRELEMEEEGQRAKQEKKAKEAQRKKDKKKAQKQRQDEERAAREAAIAEEQRLAKLKAEENAKERHRRQEEERQRRETVKRAALEEASRKEAERRKRQEEERAREAEAALKKREREEKIKKEREAREREAKEKERREREEKERLAKDKAEKDRIAREARDKAEKERLAKLEEERLEKQRRDQAEQQRKMIATQQAAREKAAAEKAAAAERAKATAAAAAVRPPPGVGSNRKPSLPPTTARNGPSPPGPSPAPTVQSPPTPSAVRPVVARGPPKTPQPFGGFQQPPVPSMSYSARPTQAPPPGFGPSFARPPFPSHSPVFQQPSNGQMFPGSSSSSSPSAAPRFGAPPDNSAFDSFEASRPTLGVGYPAKSSAPSRVSSTSDDPFRAGPIGQRVGSQPSTSIFPAEDDFLSPREPIGPPGPIGSRPGAFDPAPVPPPTAAPGAGAPGGATTGRASPSQPDQVFGSAALGDDDEIVQPAARRPAPSWGKMAPPMPMSSAPGAGRWSAAPPSIWGMENTWGGSAPGGTPGRNYGGTIAGVTAGIGGLGVSGSSSFAAPGGPMSSANLLSPNEYRPNELAGPPGLGMPLHGAQHDPRRAPSYNAQAPYFGGSNIFGGQQH